jgi:hypothetical protein
MFFETFHVLGGPQRNYKSKQNQIKMKDFIFKDNEALILLEKSVRLKLNRKMTG